MPQKSQALTSSGRGTELFPPPQGMDVSCPPRGWMFHVPNLISSEIVTILVVLTLLVLVLAKS